MTTRLSWDCAGSGAPLLLLHGIGTTRDDFSALRPALEADYDVLAVDLPGHGDSPPLAKRPSIHAVTDAIEADLDTLGIGRVHVLGNSRGARIALELARRDRAGPASAGELRVTTAAMVYRDRYPRFEVVIIGRWSGAR